MLGGWRLRRFSTREYVENALVKRILKRLFEILNAGVVMSDQRVLLWRNFQKESLDWGCYINNVTIVQYFVTGTLRLFMVDLFISSHYNNF